VPDQPADPINYDMKITPEPKNREEEAGPAKKHGDKIDIGESPRDEDAEGRDKRAAHKDAA